MQIHFSPFLYIVSLAFSISQTIYCLFQLYLFLRKDESKKNISNYQKTILLFTTVSYFVFNINNLFGLFIGYSQSDIGYRTKDLNSQEKLLQLTEIIFDSMQKSILFFCTLLFKPIFTNINLLNETIDSESYSQFIFIFAILRLFFYPTIFLLLQNHISLALYFIDIFNLAEYFLLAYMFITIHQTYKSILRYKGVSNEYKRMLYQSIIAELKSIQIIIFLQIVMDTFYKSTVLAISLMDTSVFGLFILDYSYFLRLISSCLQLYSVFRLCFLSRGNIYDQQDAIFEESSITNEEEYIGPRNMVYFAQPNDMKSESFSTF